MDEEETINEEETERQTRLNESVRAAEMAEEEASAEESEEEMAGDEEGQAAKKADEHFINNGEATLLFTSYGGVEILQWLLDFIPYIGWFVNLGIAGMADFAFFIWLTGKIARGAPKSWYKAVFYGAVGGAIPIVPGYLGAIIYLYLEDHQLLKKIGGEIGKIAGKALGKLR